MVGPVGCVAPGDCTLLLCHLRLHLVRRLPARPPRRSPAVRVRLRRTTELTRLRPHPGRRRPADLPRLRGLGAARPRNHAASGLTVLRRGGGVWVDPRAGQAHPRQSYLRHRRWVSGACGRTDPAARHHRRRACHHTGHTRTAAAPAANRGATSVSSARLLVASHGLPAGHQPERCRHLRSGVGALRPPPVRWPNRAFAWLHCAQPAAVRLASMAIGRVGLEKLGRHAQGAAYRAAAGHARPPVAAASVAAATK